jgi:hypothetical protein
LLSRLVSELGDYDVPCECIWMCLSIEVT